MPAPTDSKPWYKQFWPWFIIFFPASAVVAGVITVIIAVQHRDPLIDDNWYKNGLAINQQLDKQHQAKILGIEAQISVNRDTATLELKTLNIPPLNNPELSIKLIHPTLKMKDLLLKAYRTPAGYYIAQMKTIPQGFYHLHLTNTASDWELTSGINFSSSTINTHLTAE